jgi:hypothetical protein
MIVNQDMIADGTGKILLANPDSHFPLQKSIYITGDDLAFSFQHSALIAPELKAVPQQDIID